MIVVTWGSATDTGRVRARNEDAVLAQAPVFLVADGMGGHLGGEVASQMTVETFRELLGQPTVMASDIPALLQGANEAIRLRARVDPAVSDMGTTAVGLAMVTEAGIDYWLAFNVGDSRIYRLHQGVLTQVTVDHSYVQDLVAAGRIAPEEARTHPERNIVTRVLGVQDAPVPDFWVFPPEPGERFLICSDGLSGELDDHVIAQLLSVPAEPHEIARMLVETANQAGGRDNISVIVVDVAGADPDDLGVPTEQGYPADTTPGLSPVADGYSGYSGQSFPPAQPFDPARPFDQAQSFDRTQSYTPGQTFDASQGYDQGQGYDAGQGYAPGQGYDAGQGYAPGQGYDAGQGYVPGQGYDAGRPGRTYDGAQGYDGGGPGYDGGQGYDGGGQGYDGGQGGYSGQPEYPGQPGYPGHQSAAPVDQPPAPTTRRGRRARPRPDNDATPPWGPGPGGPRPN